MTNRINGNLDTIGQNMQNISYKNLNSLPIKLTTHISSGFFSDIYGATTNLDPKNPVVHFSNQLPDYIEVVAKFMFDMKYNIRDVKYLNMVQKIIRSNISPCFPIIYSDFKVKNLDFIGINGDGVVKLKNLDNKITNGEALGVLMEYLGNTTLESYIFFKPDVKELKTILFQIYHAIYALIKYCKMNHNDLHFKNVMLYTLKKPIYLIYKFDNKIYKVYCKKYLPIIIDINGNLYKQLIRPMKDIKALHRQLQKLTPDILKKTDINTNTTSLKKFFDMNFNEFLVKKFSKGKFTNLQIYEFP